MNRSNRFSAVYFLSYLLDAPLFAMYSMLLFILTKELYISALQIAIYFTVKPLTALLSPYWNTIFRFRSIERSLCFLVIVACLPALCAPFIGSPWFAIFGFATYFFADRAAISGWMELLKNRIPKEQQSWAISRSSLIMFLTGAFVPVLAAPWMDRGLLNWRWLFFSLAILSLLRIAILFPIASQVTRVKGLNPTSTLMRPWKEAIAVLRRRPDFAFFQLIFLFGGVGLMFMQPIMPNFVNGTLHLSYTDLALAFALAKGLGYACSARAWAWMAQKVDIYLLCSIVAALAALSLGMIPLSLKWLPFLHLALFIYGVMQGGSQLGWQMSGPYFSGQEDSTTYTQVNVSAVGIRGLFAPTLGAFLGTAIGGVSTLFIGATLCLIGTLFGIVGQKAFGPQLQLSRQAK